MLWVTFIWVVDSHQRADARKANSIGISEFRFADVWEGRARIPWIARMMAFARGRASLAGTGYLGALPWRREQTYNLLSNLPRSSCQRQRAHPQFACRQS